MIDLIPVKEEYKTADERSSAAAMNYYNVASVIFPLDNAYYVKKM